jgi:fucose 4-O-acetylase-like acetyltransferase
MRTPKQYMEREMAVTQRIAWIDIARGLGIILVVYGHVLIGVSVAHPLVPSGLLSASEYTIYTFHMPLFFMLAGLSVVSSMAKGRVRFLRGKIWTIAYPYVLWSLFQGSIQVFFPHIVNAPHSAKSLLTIFWRPIGQFWFLYVLFFCHLIAFLCRANRAILFTLSIIFIPISHWLSNDIAITVAKMFPYYVAGILLSDWMLRWRPSFRTVSVSTLVLAVGFVPLSHFGRIFSENQPYALASLPASIAGILLVLSLSHLISGFHQWFSLQFEHLGQASLTIYILHILAAAGTRVVMTRFGMKGLVEQVILGTATGTLIPFAVHVLLQHFHLLSALGLASPRRKSNGTSEQNATALAT